MHNLFTGHKAFLGFFYLDYAYNNAVVHVFVQILKESICKDLMIREDNASDKMNIYSLTSGKPQCLSESVDSIDTVTMRSIIESVDSISRDGPDMPYM